MSEIRSASPQFPVSVAQEIAEDLCAEILATAKRHDLPIPNFEAECKLARTSWCGVYGCVFSTDADDCVFKLTADSTEAHFAATAIKLRKEQKVDPRGIVDLRAVFATGQKFENYHVFAIWRERAVAVGLGDKITEQFNDSNIDQFAELLDKLWKTSDKAFRIALSEQHKRGVGTASYWNWLRERVDVAKAILRGESVQTSSDFANLLAKSAALIADLEHANGDTKPVGQALRLFLEHGILICDLHGNNVGVVERKKKCPSWAIVDAGHAMILNEALAKTSIPLLKG